MTKVTQLVKIKGTRRVALDTTFHLILHSTYSAGTIPTRLMLFLRTVTQGKGVLQVGRLP